MMGNQNQKQSNQTSVLCLIRHGQREDEVPGNNWHESNRGPWYDPPLTEEGKVQAQEAANLYLERKNPVTVLYTSPFLRCLMTSAEIAKILEVPVKVVYGLGECAAAGRRGMQALQFTSIDTINEMYPDVDFSLDALGKVEEIFEDAVARLCLENVGQEIVCCAHREGIFDLSLIGNGPTRRPHYCAIARFAYHRFPKSQPDQRKFKHFSNEPAPFVDSNWEFLTLDENKKNKRHR